jgi:hypothetical protein
MKKYILTIKYDDSSDTVEWLQEEIIEEEVIVVSDLDNVTKLTKEDMLAIMDKKDYAKA